MIDVLQLKSDLWLRARAMIDFNQTKGKKALSINKYLNDKGINVYDYFILGYGLIIYIVLVDRKSNRTKYKLTGDFYEKV